MKKFLIAATLACTTLLSTPAAIADFYNKQVGNWLVFGFDGTSDKNRACVMEYQWQDGSTFQLIKDLVDGEVYIWFKNHQWNIGDAPGDYEGMTVIMQGSRGTVQSWNATYNLINKNTITIRNLQNNPDFIQAFAYLAQMNFVMPGDIENAVIPLTGTSAAINAASNCIDVSNRPTKKQGSPI